MKLLSAIVVILCLALPCFAEEIPIAEKLQAVSVTLEAISSTTSGGGSEGSGVIVTRGDYNYVLTAGHVISDLRKTRKVIDSRTGTERHIVEFDDANIIQMIYEDGSKVGKLEMLAEVLCYSNSDNGEDLALLRVKKKNFINSSAEFYLEDEIPTIASELYHIGSLQGQCGNNSVTTGILSRIGDLYLGKLYDRTTCTAFPGSSGGGVFLKDNGLYIGMIVRGRGETLNYIVPIRRIQEWAKRMDLLFILDPSLPVPTEEELKKIPIEDTGNQNWEKLTTSKGPLPTADWPQDWPDLMPFVGMSYENPFLIYDQEMEKDWSSCPFVE